MGVGLVLASAVCFSFAGVLVRAVESTNEWQVVYWRSLGFVVAVADRSCAASPRPILSILRRCWLDRRRRLAGACAWFGLLHLGVDQYDDRQCRVLFRGAALHHGLFRMAVVRRTPKTRKLGHHGRRICWNFGDGLRRLIGGRWFGNLLAGIGIIGYTVLVLSLRAGRKVDMMPLLCLGGLGRWWRRAGH